MSNFELIRKIESELHEGIDLPKCQKCGCMKETLEFIESFPSNDQTSELSSTKIKTKEWLNQMKEIKYTCLGCEHCYPAVVMNILNETYPKLTEKKEMGCNFEVREEEWPVVTGDYSSFCDGSDTSCFVAVTTLASAELTEEIAKNRPKELCIVGKTETENIGIDKVVKNIVSNSTIKTLILAGQEAKGHLTGNTILALWHNGVDENMKVIGAKGKKPILRNVNKEDIDLFRSQIEVVDMIGCEDVNLIFEKIKEVSLGNGSSKCACRDTNKDNFKLDAPIKSAKKTSLVQMDKAGYFVIYPQGKKRTIIVEHYSYDNKLQHTIDGDNAKSLYMQIIDNKWVSLLSHVAYLGKELERAELSMKYGFRYVQDGALK